MSIDCGILIPDIYKLHIYDTYNFDVTTVINLYVTLVLDSFTPNIIAKNWGGDFVLTFNDALTAGYISEVDLNSSPLALVYTNGAITGASNKSYTFAIAANDLSLTGSYQILVKSTGGQNAGFTPYLKVYDISSLSTYSSPAGAVINFTITLTQSGVVMSQVFMVDSSSNATQINIISTVGAIVTVSYPGISVTDVYKIKTVDSFGGFLIFPTNYVLTISITSVSKSNTEVGTQSISFTITFSSISKFKCQ